MRSALVAALFLCLLAPAFAEVSMDDLVGRVKGRSVNVDVLIHNPGDVMMQGPILVKVLIRPTPNDDWQQIKMWNLEKLDANERRTLHFTPNKRAGQFKSPTALLKGVIDTPSRQGIEKTGRIEIVK